MGGRGISPTRGDVRKMDPDIDIMKRQMAEEVKEKYILYKRIDELNREITKLKDRIVKLEKPVETVPKTISGDEKTW